MMRLILMCGMIGSGKSTKARQIQATSDEPVVILNDDAITHMVSGGDYTYVSAFKPIYKGLIDAGIRLAFSAGVSVCVDRTCLDVSARTRIRDVARQAGYMRHELVWFPPTQPALYYATKRWRSDSRGLPLSKWLEVATTHLQSYTNPLASETWDRVDIQQEHP